MISKNDFRIFRFLKMKLSRRQIFLIGGIGLGVLIFVLIIIFNLRSNDPATQKVTVKVWGFEDPGNLSKVFAEYKKISPNVTVDYKKVSQENYEKTLLESLALQKGPDVFVIDNNSLLKQKEYLVAADPKIFNLQKLKTLFPQVVEQDFTSGGKIYALPYSIDTLALLYNRDFFDEAGIVDPPLTWEDFQAYVLVLRRLNDFGAVVRAGAAIGGNAKTISQASDILNWLIMQNKGIVYEAENLGVDLDFGSRGAAYKALAFYLQFSSPNSNYYSWTGNQGDSFKSFSNRKTAMIFAYKKDLEAIKKTNSFLDFGIARAPQINTEEDIISYPDYIGYAVSRQSRVQAWAWDFIINTATNISAQREFLKASKNPPALRFLIGEMVNNPEMGVFARQALTARSWPQVDGEKVREIFEEVIYNSIYEGADYSIVLKQAKDEIENLLRSFKIEVNG